MQESCPIRDTFQEKPCRVGCAAYQRIKASARSEACFWPVGQLFGSGDVELNYEGMRRWMERRSLAGLKPGVFETKAMTPED
jgi:hypothetical protein